MANLYGEAWAPEFHVPGEPAFPTEFTDPNAPVTLSVYGDGSDAPAQIQAWAPPAGAVVPGEGLYRRQGAIERAGALGGYSDWYVNQIWIDPRPVDFGSIVGTKQITVNILQTYRYESRTLSPIDLGPIGGGVTILNDPLPITLPPIGELSLTFVAAVDGPPSFDSLVDFDFDNQTIAVQFLGRRVILFWHPPETGVREQVTWKTDIIKSRDGTEQRRGLRTTPRQVIQYKIRNREDQEAGQLRNLLLYFRAFTFALPIWWEQRQVSQALAAGGSTLQVSTVDVDHRVGGSVMIWEPLTRAYFDIAIASFNSTSITFAQATAVDISADALVLPLRFGYLRAEPSYLDEAFEGLLTIVEFETTDNVELAFADQAALEAAFTVHPEDSLPIITDPILMSGAQHKRQQRTRFARIDGDIGIPTVLSEDPISELSQMFETDLDDLASIRRYRAFLHWLRGSWGPFYLPTFRRDLIPDQNFQLNASSFTIEAIGALDLFTVGQPHGSLMLELPDGSQYFAKILNVAAGGANQETINLVNSFGIAATTVVAATARISWLELVRIDGDVATFFHKWAGEATLKFNLRTIQR